MPGAPVSNTPLAVSSQYSGRQRFSRQQRLLCASDYKAVFDSATFRVSHKYFLLLARLNVGPRSRLGLVVAKKNLRRSVDRNRIKRVARNTFRTNPVKDLNIDVIFLSRRGINDLSASKQNQVLQEGWQQLMNRVSRQQVDKKTSIVPEARSC